MSNTIDQKTTSQAARTAARAAFRDSFTRPRETRSADEHDRAVEAFIDQIAPLRRFPRGLA